MLFAFFYYCIHNINGCSINDINLTILFFHSIELFDASDGFLMRQKYPSNHLNSNNYKFQNGVNGSCILDNDVSNNFQRTKQPIEVHARPSISREVPPLMRKQLSINPVKTSVPLCLSFRKQVQSVYPTHSKFSIIPKLYRIEKSGIMNGQNHPDGRQVHQNFHYDPNAVGFRDLSAANNYCNPLSLKQCSTADAMDKVSALNFKRISKISIFFFQITRILQMARITKRICTVD